MKIARWVPVLWLAAGAAVAGDGLKVGAADGFWSGVRANIRLNASLMAAAPLGTEHSLSSNAPVGMAVLGDYYFSATTADPRQPRSGFRASSALLIRQPGVSLSELTWSSRNAASFGIPSRASLSSSPIGYDDSIADTVTAMPYLGFGYSGMSAKTGWGFWADIGLVVQSPSGMLGFGRVVSGGQGVDEVLRELRLSPLLQVGVNYSF